MHWLAWLLFSFRGRIPRKTYWLAQAILQVPALAGYLAVHGLAWPQPGPAKPLLIAWGFVLLVPALAVAVKRLNDRGHPVWLAAIWLGLACASALAASLDLLRDPTQWGRVEWASIA